MKKIDKFILSSFVGPFFGILFVVVFILMMQFLWLYIDELVGKGLNLRVIGEFLMWGACTMLTISIPLATLLASVMTVGQMAENNELIAIKSSGTSFGRVMIPLFGAVLAIGIGTYFVTDRLVPVAYNHIYTLREDIGKTKGEIKIPAKTFYDGIEGYILRVEERDNKTGMMYGVIVYDHTSGKGNTSVILADSAIIKQSKNKDYLTFALYSGTSYQEENVMRYRDTTLQMNKGHFAAQTMIIPLENYSFQKSNETRYGDQIRAMDTEHLRQGLDSNITLRDSTLKIQRRQILQSASLDHRSQLDTSKHFAATTPFMEGVATPMKWNGLSEERRAYQSASAAASDMATRMKNYDTDLYQNNWIIRRSTVAILRKIAQALACLIMFLIGAPIGSSVSKKGGLGSSLIIGVLFFVLYWVVDITGEKLANDGAATPIVGVFVSAAILLPLGAYLSWLAIHDTKVMHWDTIKEKFKKFKIKVRSVFRKTRIVFMGTPGFAVRSLEAIRGAGYDVVAVVTAQDSPAVRGKAPVQSPVKQYALSNGIPVMQPDKLKDPQFLRELSALKADIFVVVGFRMLPEEVWKMPPKGTFNLHAALLPQYRGAAPINWAIINGEPRSGVTTFFIDKQIDTGGIILRQDCIIEEEDSAADLHDRLMEIGATIVLETISGIEEKNVEPRVQRSFIQGSEILHPAPKIHRELQHIDWNDSSEDIHNLIRGLCPFAKGSSVPSMEDKSAFTLLRKEGGDEVLQLKIFGSRISSREAFGVEGDIAPGKILFTKKKIGIATADGALELTCVQLSGKKRMEGSAFLNGFRDIASYSVVNGTSREEIEKTRKQ